MSEGKERLHHLDGIRGIAALGVVIGHSNWPNHIKFWGFQSTFLWVDFFFVLSGFVIAYNYQMRLGEGFGVGNYMARRLARIYPAHFVMLLLLLGYEILKYTTQGSAGIAAEREAFANNNLETFLASLALVQAMGLFTGSFWNGPSWSISTEAWTYLLFGLLFLWFRRSRAMIVGGTIVLIAIAYAIILINPNRDYLSVEADFGFFRCVAGFGMGVLCFNAWLTRQGREANPGIQAAQIALMGLAFLAVSQQLYRSPLTLGAPLLFGALVYLLAVYRHGGLEKLLLIAPIRFLGRISYSLYISHAFIRRFVTTGHKVVAHKLGGVMTPEQVGDVLTLLYIPVAILFGWLIWKFVETPANDWLVKRLGKKRDPEKAAGVDAAF